MGGGGFKECDKFWRQIRRNMPKIAKISENCDFFAMILECSKNEGNCVRMLFLDIFNIPKLKMVSNLVQNLSFCGMKLGISDAKLGIAAAKLRLDAAQKKIALLRRKRGFFLAVHIQERFSFYYY